MRSVNNPSGSIGEAQNAILDLLQPKNSSAEAQPSEEVQAQESTEEIQEIEPVEIESEEQPSEDSEDSSSYEEDDALYEVKVNGQTREVSIEQLVENFSKGEDYHSKTEAIAEKVKTETKRQVDEQTAKYHKAQADYVEKLVALESQVTQPPVTQKELEELIANEDFDEYHKKKFVLEQHNQRIKSVVEAKTQEAEKLQKEQNDAFVQRQAQEMTILLDKMPELKDQAIANKLSSYLTQTGFSEQEIHSASDHRALMLAEKARKWDELQAQSKSKKVPKKAPKVIRKVGSRIQKKSEAKQQVDSQRNTLQKSGKMRDAAKMFETMINNKQM